MSAANAKLISELYAAFGRGDIGAVLGAMDASIVWNEAENFPYADRNPYVGPGAVVEGVFARIPVDWDNFQVVPAEILDAGDTVVALGRYRGTHKTTGKSINAQFVHVWRLASGKVTGFQQYADTAQVARAMAA